LPREAFARALPYGALYDRPASAAPFTERTVGELLRCSLGLSAWKQFQASRWALRVNPSSGNLHPTEAYIAWGGRVAHYAPREHALEIRCHLAGDATQAFIPPDEGCLIALTSIFWREAWKYGERAFRYCQHDVGHAIGALRFGAALLGWRATLLPRWSDAQIASLAGLDRDEDFRGAEREAAECVLAVTAGEGAAWREVDPSAVVDTARSARWHGTANTLSPSHVDWPAIGEVAAATVYPGGAPSHARTSAPPKPLAAATPPPGGLASSPLRARDIILQRRSAVAFSPAGRLGLDGFLAMMRRLRTDGPPWDVLDWPAQVHLVIFVHRVDGLVPGIYALVRDGAALAELRASMRPEFLWEPAAGDEAAGLFLLLPHDVTWAATRVSCDQDIAGYGFFSLGMLARVDASLRERGSWFYRRLFWECGLIGQVLYLEAEAAGARGTGIGCFYDDPVHEMLGLSGHDWQSLYHFSMGVPVDDERLTSAPGYEGGW